ncbi:MAG: hypothetical protein HQM09_21760 [Candidatus Riflebacteria bacterium]|nr:hypothetical protein [Candidatus Riflebacteria bacterium]
MEALVIALVVLYIITACLYQWRVSHHRDSIEGFKKQFSEKEGELTKLKQEKDELVQALNKMTEGIAKHDFADVVRAAQSSLNSQMSQNRDVATEFQRELFEELKKSIARIDCLHQLLEEVGYHVGLLTGQMKRGVVEVDASEAKKLITAREKYYQ